MSVLHKVVFPVTNAMYTHADSKYDLVNYRPSLAVLTGTGPWQPSKTLAPYQFQVCHPSVKRYYLSFGKN